MKRAILEAKNIYLSKTAIPLYIYAIMGIAMALCELQFPIANPMINLIYLIIGIIIAGITRSKIQEKKRLQQQSSPSSSRNTGNQETACNL